MAPPRKGAEADTILSQDELRAFRQEAFEINDGMFCDDGEERACHEALLKDHLRLKEYLADQAISYQKSLQQVKELAAESKDATARAEERRKADIKKVKNEAKDNQRVIQNLRNEIAGKKADIARLYQQLATQETSQRSSCFRIEELEKENAGLKGLTLPLPTTTHVDTAEFRDSKQQDAVAVNGNSIRDSITIPPLQSMVPHKPTEKGGEGLLQFLSILGNKEQDVLDTILAHVEAVHTAAAKQQRDMSSIKSTITKLFADTRISCSHRGKLKELLLLLSPAQVEAAYSLPHAAIRNMVLNFYQYREYLQRRSGVKVFLNASEFFDRKRKRTMIVEDGEE